MGNYPGSYRALVAHWRHNYRNRSLGSGRISAIDTLMQFIAPRATIAQLIAPRHHRPTHCPAPPSPNEDSPEGGVMHKRICFNVLSLSMTKLLWRLVALCACYGPAIAQSELRELDAMIDRQCAGLFWSVNQCGALEFRDAHGRAFLAMARKAAALEGKAMPLTQDEAAQQMSTELRDWLEQRPRYSRHWQPPAP